MGGLSGASSVLAVIEFTAAVSKLCFRFIEDAKHSKMDIENLAKELAELEKLPESAHKLIEGPHGDKYKTAKGFTTNLESYNSYLAKLESKLNGELGIKRSERFKRAYKWPFKKKEFTETIQKLQEFQERLSDALDLDHM